MRQGHNMPITGLRSPKRHLPILFTFILILVLIPVQTVQAEPDATPGAFGKSNPSNGTTGYSGSSIGLNWGGSSGATTYYYCWDDSNNGSCDTSWHSTGSTSGGATSLVPGTTYYWQVYAWNADGTTYADSGTWWSFSTLPGSFSKTSQI